MIIPPYPSPTSSTFPRRSTRKVISKARLLTLKLSWTNKTWSIIAQFAVGFCFQKFHCAFFAFWSVRFLVSADDWKKFIILHVRHVVLKSSSLVWSVKFFYPSDCVARAPDVWPDLNSPLQAAVAADPNSVEVFWVLRDQSLHALHGVKDSVYLTLSWFMYRLTDLSVWLLSISKMLHFWKFVLFFIF